MAKEKRSDVHPVRKGALSVLINFILLVFSISCIFPIIWMIYSSLKEKRAFNADVVGLPFGRVHVEQYSNNRFIDYPYCTVFIYCGLYPFKNKI